MPDPLATVLRVRRVTADDARRHLAVALRAEKAAEADAADAEAAITAEREVASDLLAGDGAVEAFATWLPVGRARVEAARAAYARAGSEVAMARAALTAARAAAESADNLIERRKAAADAQAARKQQTEMDEIASQVRVPANL